MSPRREDSSYRVLGLAWGFGWRVAAGTLIGYQLDTRLETGGIFTLVLAIAALAMGTRSMIRATGRERGEGR